MTYSLYRVTYTFSVPSESSDYHQKESYVVVGEDEEEARKKADAAFMQTPFCQQLRVHEKDLTTRVRKMPDKKIRLPSASFAEDAEQFRIRARLSRDGKSLEFFVQKK